MAIGFTTPPALFKWFFKEPFSPLFITSSNFPPHCEYCAVYLMVWFTTQVPFCLAYISYGSPLESMSANFLGERSCLSQLLTLEKPKWCIPIQMVFPFWRGTPWWASTGYNLLGSSGSIWLASGSLILVNCLFCHATHVYWTPTVLPSMLLGVL